MFDDLGLRIKTLLDFPEISEIEETGTTFEENARLKAEKLSNILGIPVLSDDSGLVVDALNGRPGVYSARYAGENKNDLLNNEKLLSEMNHISDDERTARFVCVIAIAIPDKDTVISKGEVQGKILREPRGNNGFGYDPLFLVPNEGMTMAELSPSKKNQLSHRYNALIKMKKELQKLT